MIEAIKARPTAYMPNDQAFWEDAYISKQMLAAHLDPEMEAATRKHAFVRASAAWIATLKQGGDLLDLGCGPGIYAELLDEAGFRVTGIDLSPRSIEYARTSAEGKNRRIRYLQKNYLTLSDEDAYDVIVLIYCDFGVLAPDIRVRFLKKVYRALRPGGIFLVDAWTDRAYEDFDEGRSISVENGGFWSPDEYVCVKCDRVYGSSVVLEQYNVITAEAMRTYNIWNQMFDEESLARMMRVAGFSASGFYGDVCGSPRAERDKTICVVATK